MKSYILTLALTALMVVSINAQTNSVVSTNNTTSVTSITQTNEVTDFGKYDITFSSAGGSYGGNTQGGIDVSVSSNPFEQLSSLWFGVSQSVYWAPSFGGATDIDADWNVSITDKICVLGGWSAGDVYGAGVDNLIRTGPEAIVQYYFDDHVYAYGQVNYDLLTQQSGQGWQTSNSNNNGWRWSVGFGVEF